MTQILKEWADWYVSCAGGNIPPEAQAAYDAIDEIEALRAANNSVRDYFAGQAFGAVMGTAVGLGKITEKGRYDLFKDMSAIIYEATDAMLEARNVR